MIKKILIVKKIKPLKLFKKYLEALFLEKRKKFYLTELNTRTKKLMRWMNLMIFSTKIRIWMTWIFRCQI